MGAFTDNYIPPEPTPHGGAMVEASRDAAARMERIGLAEAYPEPREVVDIVGDIESYIRCYCVLPDAAYLPLTVWCLATHLADRFDCFPYLALLSPAKRCGKTRLLETLEVLCSRPWRGTAPSPASLYRMMADCPTLLLDEVEGLKGGKNASETQQAVLAVLNAGHRRGATVPRCAGKDQHLEYFPVYGPKAFAAIGRLPDTLADRSIVVTIQRKSKDQRIERFLFGKAKLRARPILKVLSRWIEESGDDVRAAYERLPDLGFLSDRDADLWMPLFAVCSIAARERLPDLKRSATELSGAKQADDAEDSVSLKLLADIRAIWPDGEDHLATTDLIERLRNLDESPWSEYEITARKLGKWLRPFGIASANVRVGQNISKGYRREDLKPVWSRYLASGAVLSATPLQSA